MCVDLKFFVSHDIAGPHVMVRAIALAFLLVLPTSRAGMAEPLIDAHADADMYVYVYIYTHIPHYVYMCIYIYTTQVEYIATMDPPHVPNITVRAPQREQVP